MKNTGKISRIFFAFVLSLSLGVAPTLTVYAQQAPQKQPASQAKSSAKKTQQATEEKQEQLAESELLPLSDAEMEKVEGGIAWGPIVVRVLISYVMHRVTQRSCK